MSIIKIKDIYDPSQGDPFKVLAKNIEDIDKMVVDFIKTMDLLTKSIKSMSTATDGSSAKKLNEETAKLEATTAKLNETQKKRKEIVTTIQTAQERLVEIEKERVKGINALKKANSDNIQKNEQLKVQLIEQRKINKELAKEKLGLISVYQKESKRLIALRTEYKNVAVQEGIASKKALELNKEVTALNDKLVKIDKSAGQFGRVVGDYPKSMDAANKSTFNWKGGLKSLGSQLLAAGGVVGAVSLLIDGLKLYAKTAGEVSSISKKLIASFGLSEKAAKSNAAEIRAIASAFDEDYNEVTQAAITVSKELGISVRAATKQIEEGFLKGSNNTGEFLDILKEYPVQMAKAGIKADEFFAIVQQQVTSGVYSDKGIDAIKEGGISLKENTQIVKDALAPLGETVSLEIQREAATGSSFKAMQLLVKSMKDGNLTAAESQTIMSDIFRGAGEDAESFVLNLDNLNSSLETTVVTATQVDEANLALSKSWASFVASTTSSEGILSSAWAGILNGVSGILTEAKAFGLLMKGEFTEANRVAEGGADLLGKSLKRVGDEGEKTGRRLTTAEKAQRDQVILTDKQRAQQRKNFLKFQAEKEAAAQKDIENNQKKIDALNKQIAAQDEADERSVEIFEAEEERQDEGQEKTIELQDFDLARQAEFEANKTAITEEAAAQRDAVIRNSLQIAGEALGQLLFDSEAGFKEYSKAILGVALDAAQKFVLIKLAEITANELAKKSFVGVGTAAILGGIALGVLAKAKATLSLADGTEYVHGPGTSKSDSIPANLSVGERVVDADNNGLMGNISNDLLPAAVAVYRNKGNDYETKALLAENISTNKKMVGLLSNLGYSYTKGNQTIVVRLDGTGTEIIPNRE